MRSTSPGMMRLTGLLAALSLCVLTGCGLYRFGAASLYPLDVKTVHVPVFESESFRRNLGERLTEAVIKEIESKTPYKVVGDANADSTLVGRIVEDRKRVTVENRNDDVREAETSLIVQVTWTKRDGALLAQNNLLRIDPVTLGVLGSSALVPEVGQSVTTAQQTAIRRIAQQVVGLMEAPW